MKQPRFVYKPWDYWENLLQKGGDLRSVGYPSFSYAFNSCLYRAMADSVDRGLNRLGMVPASFEAANIIDVGSGTGFWVGFWLGKGTRQILGIDLTPGSITSLRHKYPQLEFQQRDVAGLLPADFSGKFDIVSAMSVLHHIPEQQRWENALWNLGHALKPGGYLLLMDPVLRYKWWGKPFDDTSNGFPRTLSEHLAILEPLGVKLKLAIPTIVILANPVDTKSKLEFQLLKLWWLLFSRVARREPVMKRTAWFVYSIDRLLCKSNYMPSSKTLFYQKDGH